MVHRTIVQSNNQKQNITQNSQTINPNQSLLSLLLLHPEYIWFTSRTLALCFFRLPILTGILLDAICTIPPLNSNQQDHQQNETDENNSNNSTNTEIEMDSQNSWKIKMNENIEQFINEITTPPISTPHISRIHSPISPIDSNASTVHSPISGPSTPISYEHISPPSPISDLKNDTNLFIQLNPNLFDWTRPELNHDMLSPVYEQMNSNESDMNTQSNINSNDEHLNTYLWCIKILLSNNNIYFHFTSSWLHHIHRLIQPIHGYIDFLLIPAYYLMISSILKRFISCTPMLTYEDDEDNEMNNNYKILQNIQMDAMDECRYWLMENINIKNQCLNFFTEVHILTSLYIILYFNVFIYLFIYTYKSFDLNVMIFNFFFLFFFFFLVNIT
jgi:hypothetical protein